MKNSTPSKRVITAHIIEISPYEFEGNLFQLKEKINEWIKEYGPDVKLNWDPNRWFPYDTAPSPTYNLEVDRLETDEELSTRLQKENAYQKQADDRDRAEFERLKKKFNE